MKFAVNYSPQAIELVRSGCIHFDYFKCPPWPDLVSTAREVAPVVIHFELQAGSGCLHKTDWRMIEDFLAHTGTPFVNLHLAPRVGDFPDMPVDTWDFTHIRQVTEVLLRDTAAVVDHFGPERVIAENALYEGPQGKFFRPAMLPEVIHQILDETGCGMLLDISHARISAYHLGLNERDYMASLPVDRIRELHFTGIHEVNGRLQDHLSVLPGDWPVLDWALERIERREWAAPWLLAFEYGGVGEFFGKHTEMDVLIEQVPLLLSRVCQVTASSTK